MFVTESLTMDRSYFFTFLQRKFVKELRKNWRNFFNKFRPFLMNDVLWVEGKKTSRHASRKIGRCVGTCTYARFRHKHSAGKFQIQIYQEYHGFRVIIRILFGTVLHLIVVHHLDIVLVTYSINFI